MKASTASGYRAQNLQVLPEVHEGQRLRTMSLAAYGGSMRAGGQHVLHNPYAMRHAERKPHCVPGLVEMAAVARCSHPGAETSTIPQNLSKPELRKGCCTKDVLPSVKC